MTAKSISRHSAKIIASTSVLLMICLLYSCAKKTTTLSKAAPATASEAPIAAPPANKGQVEIRRDVKSNYVIQINLRELEEVNKLESTSKKAYIVWMNADGQMTKNLGQINSNSGWLSDKSKASFDAISEFKPTKIFITEEDLASVKKPGTKIIWSTNRF